MHLTTPCNPTYTFGAKTSTQAAPNIQQTLYSQINRIIGDKNSLIGLNECIYKECPKSHDIYILKRFIDNTGTNC